jgi:hydroxyacylglutathione hydrolase
VRANLPNRPKIALHPADLDLWREGGGSKQFRVLIDLPESPDISLSDGQMLNLGNGQIETRSAPGHSPGSVVFYIPELQTAVCGDVIFHHGIGRTDLADGNFDLLMTSIRTKIFTLPPKTRLIPGHGIETTVEEEKLHNPFINFSPK